MKALIVIDIQNDFLPGGPLGVPHGDEVVARANGLMGEADLVVATQDWHPRDHGSFAENHSGTSPGEVIEWNGLIQILWPVHCVEGTAGAEFAAGLNTERFEAIFRKGTDREVDSYSGFYDNGHRRSTGLAGYLREREVKEIHLCGLATDYCVKFTALDAVGAGFTTILETQACRGVDLASGDVSAAIEEMRSKGVRIEE